MTQAASDTPKKKTASKKSSRAKNGKPATFTVTNPVTGEAIRELPIHSSDDIEAMALKARGAFESWRQVPFRERAEAMYRFRELCLDRLDEGLDLMIQETGKSWVDAHADFISAFLALSYYGKKGERLLRDERRNPFLLKNKSSYVSYKPMGVAGIIAPWNFPFDLAVGEAIPALMAGCAVIVKPSEVTPLITLWAADIFRESGLPDGLFQVTTGDGSTGAALIPHVDRITFTGSTATGRKVAAACGQRLIPCTLELGGKDAMIVCDDADVERASGAAVFGAFFNAGQMCTSVERCYVHEDIYDEFVERVVARAGKIRLEPRGDRRQDVGSLTFPPQLKIIEKHVQDARDKGANIPLGGRLRPDIGPLVYEPTVLTGVNHQMLIMRDETFGPVLPIMKVRSDEEAVTLANDSNYGLNSAVWSTDSDRSRRIARKLRVGTTEINDTATSHLAVECPFGGVNDSGVGRRRGPEGIRKFCHQQTVVRELIGLKDELWWYPLPEAPFQHIRKVMNFLFRRSWREKLMGKQY